MIKVHKTTMKEQAYQIIKNKILTQAYALGEKINIDNLVRELNISNSPIREALTMLEKDGMVTTNPNSGTKVIELSEESFTEISQTIHILLLGGYDICVSQGKTEELVSKMGQCLKIQEDLLAHKDYFNFVKSAITFDESFLTVAGNKYLISISNSLHGIYYLAILYDHQHRDIDRKGNIYEHKMIMEAIASGNHNEVKKLLSIHFDKHI